MLLEEQLNVQVRVLFSQCVFFMLTIMDWTAFKVDFLLVYLISMKVERVLESKSCLFDGMYVKWKVFYAF